MLSAPTSHTYTIALSQGSSLTCFILWKNKTLVFAPEDIVNSNPPPFFFFFFNSRPVLTLHHCVWLTGRLEPVLGKAEASTIRGDFKDPGKGLLLLTCF